MEIIHFVDGVILWEMELVNVFQETSLDLSLDISIARIGITDRLVAVLDILSRVSYAIHIILCVDGVMMFALELL